MVFTTQTTTAQDKTYEVEAFEKVIVSPHIEVTLMEGDEESVTINNAKVAMDKINVTVEGKTLRLYLDDARVVTKSEKITKATDIVNSTLGVIKEIKEDSYQIKIGDKELEFKRNSPALKPSNTV